MCGNVFLLSIKKFVGLDWDLFVFHDVGPASNVGGLVWVLQTIVEGPSLFPSTLRNDRKFAVFAPQLPGSLGRRFDEKKAAKAFFG